MQNSSRYLIFVCIILFIGNSSVAQQPDSLYRSKFKLAFFNYILHLNKGNKFENIEKQITDLMNTGSIEPVFTGFFENYKFFNLSYGYHEPLHFSMVFDNSGETAVNISIDSFNRVVNNSKHTFSNLEKCYFFLLLNGKHSFMLSDPSIYRKTIIINPYMKDRFEYSSMGFDDRDTVLSYLEASTKVEIFIGVQENEQFSLLLFNFNKRSDLTSVDYIMHNRKVIWYEGRHIFIR